MKRRAACFAIAATAALTGCGKSALTSVGWGGVAPQPSWMSPAAKSKDLLYVSTRDDNGATYVYTYPQGRLVGGVSNTGYSYGLCSDARGDVFITNDYAIYEYPHGRASPSATITNPYGATTTCSVDPVSGNLAATTMQDLILVFRPSARHGWNIAKSYELSEVPASCAYDGSGDLFVDGLNPSGRFLAELAKGRSSFVNVTVDKVRYPENLAWDGKYLAVGEHGNVAIHRVKFNGTKGTQVGVTRLRGVDQIFQYWIAGSTLIGPASDSGQFVVGFWPYPKGGAPQGGINQDTTYGVTVSVAPSI